MSALSLIRFDQELRWHPRVQIIPVECDSSNNFQDTKEALEAAYDRALESGVNVKGLILTTVKPTRHYLGQRSLRSLARFTNKRNIHFVCDEIYAATIFRSPSFTSIAEVIDEMECNKDLFHIVYSLSKDMGLPGFRVGIVYLYNDEVVYCARKMSSFGLVSSQTQFLLASMLSDEEFIENSVRELQKFGQKVGNFEN